MLLDDFTRSKKRLLIAVPRAYCRYIPTVFGAYNMIVGILTGK